MPGIDQPRSSLPSFPLCSNVALLSKRLASEVLPKTSSRSARSERLMPRSKHWYSNSIFDSWPAAMRGRDGPLHRRASEESRWDGWRKLRERARLPLFIDGRSREIIISSPAASSPMALAEDPTLKSKREHLCPT